METLTAFILRHLRDGHEQFTLRAEPHYGDALVTIGPKDRNEERTFVLSDDLHEVESFTAVEPYEG